MSSNTTQTTIGSKVAAAAKIFAGAAVEVTVNVGTITLGVACGYLVIQKIKKD